MAQMNTGSRKRNYYAVVDGDHAETRKRLRKMGLNEITAHVIDLEHRLAAASQAQTAPANRPVNGFVHLPEELVASIVARLAQADVAACFATCRSLRDIVTWHMGALVLRNMTHTLKTTQWLNTFKSLMALHIAHCDIVYDGEFTHASACLTLPALRELSIHDSWIAYRRLFVDLTRLDVLRIDKLREVRPARAGTHNPLAADNLLTLPSARSLELRAVLPSKLVCDPSTMRVEKLKVSDMRFDQSIIAMATSFAPTLTTLTLEGLTMMGDDDIAALDPLANLAEFTLRHAPFVTLKGMADWKTPHPHLARLTLDTCADVHETFFLAVCRTLPSLTHVSVIGAPLVHTSGDSVSSSGDWCTAMPCVTSLEIYCPDSISYDYGAVLFPQIARLPTLRHLTLHNTWTVSMDMLSALFASHILQLETLCMGECAPDVVRECGSLYDIMPSLQTIRLY